MAARHKLLPIVFCLAVVLSTLATIPTVKGLTWSAPSSIPLSTAEAFNPSVAEDPVNGRIYLAWQSNIPGQEPDIYVKYYVQLSQLWTSDQRITTDPEQDLSPSILRLSNSSLLVFWSSNRTGTFDIFYRNLGDPSRTDVPVTSGSANDRKPYAVQDHQGKVWVFWERGESGIYDIYYKTLTGGVWSAEQNLTQTPQFDLTPSAMVANDGKVWAEYAVFERTDYNLYLKSYDGQNWSPAARVASTSADETSPFMVQARDGTIWLFWAKEVGLPQGAFQTDIYHQSSVDNGVTWSGDQPLTNTDYFEESPAVLQVSDKTLWLFYDSNPSLTFGFSLYYQRSNQISAHDVGVQGVQSPRVRRPEIANVTTTLLNLGDFVESLRLNLYVNGTFASAKDITMLPGETLDVILPWPTSTVLPKCYPAMVTITNLVTEPVGNTGNNSGKGYIVVLAPGDVDRNGSVNIFDAVRVGRAFDSRPGDPNWDPAADLNKNGVVDIFDAATVGRWYDTNVPPSC